MDVYVCQTFYVLKRDDGSGHSHRYVSGVFASKYEAQEHCEREKREWSEAGAIARSHWEHWEVFVA